MDMFCLNYQNISNIRKRMDASMNGGMLNVSKELLESLIYTIKLRETYLPINKMTPKIQKQFYRIVSRIGGFRKVHRNKVSHAMKLSNQKATATGNIKSTNKKDNNNNNNNNDDDDDGVSSAFFKSMTQIINQVDQHRQQFNK